MKTEEKRNKSIAQMLRLAAFKTANPPSQKLIDLLLNKTQKGK